LCFGLLRVLPGFLSLDLGFWPQFLWFFAFK
jgi:hypothetical protein